MTDSNPFATPYPSYPPSPSITSTNPFATPYHSSPVILSTNPFDGDCNLERVCSIASSLYRERNPPPLGINGGIRDLSKFQKMRVALRRYFSKPIYEHPIGPSPKSERKIRVVTDEEWEESRVKCMEMIASIREENEKWQLQLMGEGAKEYLEARARELENDELQRSGVGRATPQNIPLGTQESGGAATETGTATAEASPTGNNSSGTTSPHTNVSSPSSSLQQQTPSYSSYLSEEAKREGMLIVTTPSTPQDSDDEDDEDEEDDKEPWIPDEAFRFRALGDEPDPIESFVFEDYARDVPEEVVEEEVKEEFVPLAPWMTVESWKTGEGWEVWEARIGLVAVGGN